MDALRGWAVVGMLGGHAGAVLLWPGWQAVPAVVFAWFVLLAGGWWRPGVGWRWVRLVAGFVVSWWPAAWLGLAAWGILGKWVIVVPVLAAASVAGAAPVGVAVVAGTYAVWYGWWDWGLVLLLWCVGRGFGPLGVVRMFGSLPCWRWVLWLGRHSLGVYVWHLWVLAGVVAITGHNLLR